MLRTREKMKSSVVKDGHHEDALNDLNNSKHGETSKQKLGCHITTGMVNEAAR